MRGVYRSFDLQNSSPFSVVQYFKHYVYRLDGSQCAGMHPRAWYGKFATSSLFLCTIPTLMPVINDGGTDMDAVVLLEKGYEKTRSQHVVAAGGYSLYNLSTIT